MSGAERGAGLLAQHLSLTRSWLAVRCTDTEEAVALLVPELEDTLGTPVAQDFETQGAAVRLLRLAQWTDDQIRALDSNRTALVGGPPTMLVGLDTDLARFAMLAPHIWSWVGPDLWDLDETEGVLDVEARLRSLREGTGLTNDEVLARAERGELPAEPLWAEWLALLGRGDLVGR
jgi:hypothetical protein